MSKIAIIGAGVSGLSTGVKLLEAGHKVIIFAKEIHPNTTSNVAAAIWLPYKIAPEQRALAWAITSLKIFKKLAQQTPQAGIIFKRHTELLSSPIKRLAYSEYLPTLPVPDYIPAQYKAHSYSLEIPVIDTQKYMPYLHLFLSIL